MRVSEFGGELLIRLVAVLAALVLLVPAACWIAGLFGSEEERIRARLESMRRGFDAGEAGQALIGLAPEWRDARSGMDRPTLAFLLGQTLREERGPDGEPLLRAVVPEERLRIELDPHQPLRATVGAEIAIERHRSGRVDIRRRLEVEAQLEKCGRRWWIVASTHAPLR